MTASLKIINTSNHKNEGFLIDHASYTPPDQGPSTYQGEFVILAPGDTFDLPGSYDPTRSHSVGIRLITVPNVESEFEEVTVSVTKGGEDDAG